MKSKKRADGAAVAQRFYTPLSAAVTPRDNEEIGEVPRGGYKREPRKVGGRERSEAVIYRGMLARCRNPKRKDFHFYGGRGIGVCERWSGPNGCAHFIADMGPRPSTDHWLDRIDTDGDYEPGNCRWALVVEQQRNRRDNRLVTIDGVTKCASAWAEGAGITRQHFVNRLNRGWDPAIAARTPAGLSKAKAHREA